VVSSLKRVCWRLGSSGSGQAQPDDWTRSLVLAGRLPTVRELEFGRAQREEFSGRGLFLQGK
jgi:hypothetical protein